VSQWTWTAPHSGKALQMARGQLKINLYRDNAPVMILCRRWQVRGRGRRDRAGRSFLSSQSEVESLGMAKEGARFWRSRAIVLAKPKPAGARPASSREPVQLAQASWKAVRQKTT